MRCGIGCRIGSGAGNNAHLVVVEGDRVARRERVLCHQAGGEVLADDDVGVRRAPEGRRHYASGRLLGGGCCAAEGPWVGVGAHEWQRKLSRSCSVMEEEKRRAPAEDVAIWI